MSQRGLTFNGIWLQGFQQEVSRWACVSWQKTGQIFPVPETLTVAVNCWCEIHPDDTNKKSNIFFFFFCMRSDRGKNKILWESLSVYTNPTFTGAINIWPTYTRWALKVFCSSFLKWPIHLYISKASFGFIYRMLWTCNHLWDGEGISSPKGKVRFHHFLLCKYFAVGKKFLCSLSKQIMRYNYSNFTAQLQIQAYERRVGSPAWLHG